MKYLGRYLMNIGSLVSIFLNIVIFFGAPSEALSERCGRHEFNKSNKFFGYYLRHFIDFVFFFDEKHCLNSYLGEISGEVFR